MYTECSRSIFCGFPGSTDKFYTRNAGRAMKTVINIKSVDDLINEAAAHGLAMETREEAIKELLAKWKKGSLSDMETLLKIERVIK